MEIRMFKFLILPIFAYLIGSIPWGLVLTRIFTSADILQQGSKNVGATNVRRIAGPTLGMLTLILDVLKGAFPVWLAITIAAPNEIWGEFYISLVGIAAFLGHLFPVYMKFKNGGKGIATAGGCFTVISPPAAGVTILVFIMIACWSDRISPASLAASATLPVVIWKATDSGIFTGYAVVSAIFICVRHADNIKRLLGGSEPTI